MIRHRQTLCILLIASTLAGCGIPDRLANVGLTPKLSEIEDPTMAPDYRPVRMPMPDPAPKGFAANSLWRQGNRSFFKDIRAQRVGDILTVKVKVADTANIDNATKRQRAGNESLGGAGSYNVTSPHFNAAGSADGDASLKSQGSSEGSGSVKRSEQLVTNVAAVVTQVLPNGNLVIEGKQEIRVNFEIRELVIAGIIRPEDIEADNTLESAKIAETRLAYGGRGQITDVQQPRYGQQVMDILLPF